MVAAGLFSSSTGNVHGHDAGAMENYATPTGDNALAGLAGFRVLFQRGGLHFLHDLKLPRALIFFLRNCFVGVSRHDGIVTKQLPKRKGRAITQ